MYSVSSSSSSRLADALRLQTIAKSIEHYSNQLEGLFLEEMFPRKLDEDEDEDVARPSAWLTKAKLVVQGDKKVEPFVFRPQVRDCVFSGEQSTDLSSIAELRQA